MKQGVQRINMLESKVPLQRSASPIRRNPRPLNLIPDLDVPPLMPRWFHAINNPILDPISIRKAKSTNTLNKVPIPKSPSIPKAITKWVPFSQRDSIALEKAYQNNDVRAKVPVNEDHLFEVDVSQRTISPVYWEGPMFEVRRATWFMQSDGWAPCEENLAEQIELGYYKHKPYNTKVAVVEDEPTEEKKLEEIVDKKWNLLGPYLGQHIVYTGKNQAWLFSNSTSSKFAKSIITRLTNKQNLGGTRVLRGYPEVEEMTKKSKNTTKPAVEDKESDAEEEQPQDQEFQEAEDYLNQNSEEEVRKIDHIMFVIHGVGQKMSEKTGHSFVQDVSMMRKTLKLAYPAVMATTSTPQRPNGIQVLPVMWRQDIKFGMAADDQDVLEADLGTFGVEDGCPTLDELTLEGVPNIRTVVSDVLMDVPLYMTPRYREQMTQIITREINRIYRLFIQRNPEFIEIGKISIFGHSLGSLLAFDMLALQPPNTPTENLEDFRPNTNEKHKTATLLFPVDNFFAAGSPLGVILLLRGFKIASRKSLDPSYVYQALSDMKAPSSSSINFCYPAVDNLYNIFHKSDPVAYRIEPLIARHYTTKLKPEPIPYMKGGLKSVLEASYNVGSGIANRAGAMYESIKMGLTTNLFMRGLGLTKQQIYEDTHPKTNDTVDDQSVSLSSESQYEEQKLPINRVRSNSDPAQAFRHSHTTADIPKMDSGLKSGVRKSPPVPLPTAVHHSAGRFIRKSVPECI
ncbi:DDHD domain-containing protein [Sporodiniella umbellata]|nr:DDHD domain-containing protein [Sporodiniella umbellata]